jgi:hypothetical protein
MNLSTHVLGKTTVDQLTARAATPVLTIGHDRFYRRDLARVACFNFIAAANLSDAIAHLGLKVKDVRDLFETIPPSALVVPHVGAVAIAVLGAVFELTGLGGEHPLEAWVAAHRPTEATRDFVTFDTLKHQEAKRSVGERRDRRRRARSSPHDHRDIRRYKNVKERDYANRNTRGSNAD